MRRFLILGAGGVGGALAAALHAGGGQVALLARGEHYAALREDGLLWRRPSGERRLALPVYNTLADMRPDGSDLAIVATKLPDAPPLLDELQGLRTRPTVVCAQNGLAGPAMARERGLRNFAMMVWSPCTHLTPGEIITHAENPLGVLGFSAHPELDELAGRLGAGGFDVWRPAALAAALRTKLLTNVAGVARAVLEEVPADLKRALWAEGEAVFGAARLAVMPRDTFLERMSHVQLREVGGRLRAGGSFWQSMTTGRSLELDGLVGEIVRLADTHGVPVPLHRRLYAAAETLIRSGGAPRSVPASTVTGELAP